MPFKPTKEEEDKNMPFAKAEEEYKSMPFAKAEEEDKSMPSRLTEEEEKKGPPVFTEMAREVSNSFILLPEELKAEEHQTEIYFM